MNSLCGGRLQVLIYVFDIESHERKKDLENFANCLDAIKQNSKNAHVFCLIHKMDLVQKEEERLKACHTPHYHLT